MYKYWLGVIGTWIVCDGISSLYTYTSPERKNGQSWLRDHSLRCLRILLGAIIIVIGAVS